MDDAQCCSQNQFKPKSTQNVYKPINTITPIKTPFCTHKCREYQVFHIPDASPELLSDLCVVVKLKTLLSDVYICFS